MNVARLLRSRLSASGHGQKDLARAAQVTDSYISQLLTGKKTPPAGERTDIYGKMEAFLDLEPGALARLAEAERAEKIRRRLGRTPQPLFQEFRDLVLRKCAPDRREEVREVFASHPFGTLERLVAQTMLEVVQGVARQELEREDWIRLAARLGGWSHEAMRVIVLDFLDADVFDVSRDSCVHFLEPLVESWSIDQQHLRLEILLNRELVAESRRVFAFVEGDPDDETASRGLDQLLDDPRLGADVTEEELGLLRRMRPTGRRPNKLYYYRALQCLRDPLNFEEG